MPDEQNVHAMFDRDHIRNSLANPWSPVSVLSLFFAVDFGDDADVEHGLRKGHRALEMRELWFFGPSCLDELSQPFRDVIRAAGKGVLTERSWNSSVHGKMAQLILCDQLARNAFRGSQEAFLYDDRSVALARELTASLLGDASVADVHLSGEFFPPYFIFLLTAFMHSECIEDHLQLNKVLDHADAHSPAILHDWFKTMRKGGEAHTNVVQNFGRYPHRNAALGRTNTDDENAWLADIENLPGWAKSQMPSR